MSTYITNGDIAIKLCVNKIQKVFISFIAMDNGNLFSNCASNPKWNYDTLLGHVETTFHRMLSHISTEYEYQNIVTANVYMAWENVHYNCIQ